MLRAIWWKLEGADVIFALGEQNRLANVLAAMAQRKDFDVAGFQEWLREMDRTDFAIWRKNPPETKGLQRFENDTYLLNAFVARLAQGEKSAAAGEAEKAALKSLRRR